ncbi:PREDICTED: uncharacterized protein LOC102010966 [Chinchilla lanigera]|uniref:uncharacterized protein LOC102010966 n=1 Tax=Chinchilla lanigera TaxID=34839 RepID=UPI000696E316|nr:PREDICTED: uncharacterized protein LOC102010966 [Chinchilla lanigera]
MEVTEGQMMGRQGRKRQRVQPGAAGVAVKAHVTERLQTREARRQGPERVSGAARRGGRTSKGCEGGSAAAERVFPQVKTPQHGPARGGQQGGHCWRRSGRGPHAVKAKRGRGPVLGGCRRAPHAPVFNYVFEDNAPAHSSLLLGNNQGFAFTTRVSDPDPTSPPQVIPALPPQQERKFPPCPAKPHVLETPPFPRPTSGHRGNASSLGDGALRWARRRSARGPARLQLWGPRGLCPAARCGRLRYRKGLGGAGRPGSAGCLPGRRPGPEAARTWGVGGGVLCSDPAAGTPGGSSGPRSPLVEVAEDRETAGGMGGRRGGLHSVTNVLPPAERWEHQLCPLPLRFTVSGRGCETARRDLKVTTGARSLGRRVPWDPVFKYRRKDWTNKAIMLAPSQCSNSQDGLQESTFLELLRLTVFLEARNCCTVNLRKQEIGRTDSGNDHHQYPTQDMLEINFCSHVVYETHCRWFSNVSGTTYHLEDYKILDICRDL